MKVLRELLILSVMALVVSLSSCTSPNNDPFFGYVFVREIETTNYQTGKVSVSTFDYVQYDKNYDPKPIVNGVVSSIPMLSRQTMTNSNVSEISYVYTDKMKGLNIKTKSVAGDTEDKYRLNDLMMADAKLVGGNYVELDNIKYDAKGYRTYYNGLKLKSESAQYISVEKDGEIVATYDYTGYPNFMALQQDNIPGEEYYNACDNFGKQSRYFLSRAVIKEQGANVVYEYRYSFDYNGYVQEEQVMRDGKQYIARKYRYSSVTVSNDTNAK